MNEGAFYYMLCRLVPLLFAPPCSTPRLRGVVHREDGAAIVAITDSDIYENGVAVTVQVTDTSAGPDIDDALDVIWSTPLSSWQEHSGPSLARDSHDNVVVALDWAARNNGASVFPLHALGGFISQRLGIGHVEANDRPRLAGFMMTSATTCRVYFASAADRLGVDVLTTAPSLGAPFMSELHARLAAEATSWLRPVSTQDTYCGANVFAF